MKTRIMKIKYPSIKKIATMVLFFFHFFTFRAEAQGVEGIYTIQQANDGILNKTAGTVEIKKMVYVDTNRIQYKFELEQYDQDKIFKKGNPKQGYTYYGISTYESDNEYEFKECYNGQGCRTRILKIHGNGNGTYGNEVEISCPLKNPTNRGQNSREEDACRETAESRWTANLEPGVIVRKRAIDHHRTIIYDITELLVKQGSVQEQNGWVMSQWLIDLSKSTAKCVCCGGDYAITSGFYKRKREIGDDSMGEYTNFSNMRGPGHSCSQTCADKFFQKKCSTQNPTKPKNK